jgi:uncharacterized protein
MKNALVASCYVFLLILSNGSSADVFLSSKIKALIVKGEAGDADAQFRVGLAYDTGNGAPRDGNEAMKWYRMAAARGHVEAQNSIGSGLQAAKRYEEALPWYEEASAQGHALATNNLAYLYDLGLGVKQDRRKALELYLRAADLGWAEAMWNIANIYGAGQLGEKDMVNACVWTMRARKFAAPREQQLLNNLSRVIPNLERTLTAEQLIICRKQLDNWAPIELRKDGAKPGGQQDSLR